METVELKTKLGIQQWVCFKLGQEEFGVDILKVREIVRMETITHVPQTPVSVAGVVNLRGNVIPVINLPRKLGIPDKELDEKARIIVFFIGDKLIGMIVDCVERVLRIRKEQIEPPPDIGTGRIQDYILSIGKLDKNLIIQLNIDKILTEEEIIQIEEIRKLKTEAARLSEKTPDAGPAKPSAAPIEASGPPLKKSRKSTPVKNKHTGKGVRS